MKNWPSQIEMRYVRILDVVLTNSAVDASEKCHLQGTSGRQGRIRVPLLAEPEYVDVVIRTGILRGGSQQGTVITVDAALQYSSSKRIWLIFMEHCEGHSTDEWLLASSRFADNPNFDAIEWLVSPFHPLPPRSWRMIPLAWDISNAIIEGGTFGIKRHVLSKMVVPRETVIPKQMVGRVVPLCLFLWHRHRRCCRSKDRIN
jgi:hypothetical protein